MKNVRGKREGEKENRSERDGREAWKVTERERCFTLSFKKI